MKKFKKMCAVFISIMMLISCLTVTSFAAETGAQDGLKAVIQTDKESYSANEDIHITVTVTNTNTFEVKNVSIESLLPDALTLKDGKLKSKTVDLKPGETLSISCVVMLEKENHTTTVPNITEPITKPPMTTKPDTTKPVTEPPITTKPGTTRPVTEPPVTTNPSTTKPITEPSMTTKPEESTILSTTIAETTPIESSTIFDTTVPEIPSTTNTGTISPVEPSTIEHTTEISECESTTTIKHMQDNPDTGSDSIVINVLLIALASAAIIVAIVLITRKNNKKATKVISLILCCAIAISSFATVGFIKVGAEEGTQRSFSVDKTIAIDNTDYTLQAKVGYDKAEEEQTTWYQGIDKEHVVVPKEGASYIDNRIIILFWSNATDEQKQYAVDSVDGTIIGNDNDLKYQVQIPEATSKEELNNICNRVQTLPGVSLCYFEMLDKISDAIQTIPNDPWKDVFQGIFETDWDESNPEGLNWWLETIQAPSAWDYNSRFSNIRIGVADNGFDTEHEDLNLTVINPNENSNDGDMGKRSHGTHVSGVIGATANNGIGITGLVWNKDLYCADIMATKKQTEDFISVLDKYEAFEALLERGCRVINFSMGASNPLSEQDISISGLSAAGYLIHWIDTLNRDDFIFVQAAGNESVSSRRNGTFCSITNTSVEQYLNTQSNDIREKYRSYDIYKHFITVGAIDKPSSNGTYTLSDFSNFGDDVSIVAPGRDIFSTIRSGGVSGNYGHFFWDGTSMAAPMVTGVASLVWSVNSEFTAEQVKDIVCNSTDKTASSSNQNDSRESYPIVNAKLAVEEAIRRTDNKCSVSGSVIDAETKQPLDATVEVSQLDETTKCKTNPQDGSFNLKLEAGEYTIRITSPGYQSISTTFNVPSGTNYNLGEFTLTHLPEQKTTITGYVKDKGTKKYLSDVTVTAYNENGTEVITNTTTDKNGYYEIVLEREGYYDLKFGKNGYDEYTLDNVQANKGMNGIDPVLLSPIEDGRKTYYISTPEEFNNIRNDLNGNYILMNDIDLSAYAENWQPIGMMVENSIGGFKGHLNGNGHTVYGFNVSNFDIPSQYKYNTWGLFGFLNSTAVIENLDLEGGIYLKNAYAPNGSGVQLGSIAGTGWGTIKNCSFRGFIYADIYFSPYMSWFVDVGGIAGSEWYGGNMNVIDCKNYGSIQIMAETNKDVFVAGIIARGTAKHCYNSGNIACFTSGDNNISYVMGITFDQAIDCCNAAGSMSADSYYHSVVVRRISNSSSDYVKNCVANKDMLINGKTVKDSVQNGTGMSSDSLTDWYNKHY